MPQFYAVFNIILSSAFESMPFRLSEYSFSHLHNHAQLTWRV